MSIDFSGDAIKTFLSLSDTVTYEDIIFNLSIEIGDNGLLIGYKLFAVLSSSRYYLGNLAQSKWDNPHTDGPTEWLYFIEHIQNDFDLRMTSLQLHQVLVEKDIVEGEKQSSDF